jgi:putative oxidoreductase
MVDICWKGRTMPVTVPDILQGSMTLIGRISLCAIFLTNAVGFNIPNFEEVVSAIVLAIGILLAGSGMLIVGWKSKVGAALLLFYLTVSNMYFHNFWVINDPVMHKLEMVQFLKNLSLMGAMLLIVANGSGPYSLDLQKSPRAKFSG